MRSGGQAVALWRMLLPAIALMLCSEVMAKDDPKFSVTKFEHPPLNINYFEDSDVIIFHDVLERSIYRSEDAGASWGRVKDIPQDEAVLYMHPFEPQTAFFITEGSKHYKTGDRGASWTEFDTGCLASPDRERENHQILTFHADDPKRIIFNGMTCNGIFCTEEARYTTNGFKSVDQLRSFTNGCRWAKSSKEFTTGDKKMDKSRIMCIGMDRSDLFATDRNWRLYISDSFFKDQYEPNMDSNKAVGGVRDVAIVKKYFLVATRSLNSDEMALFVSDDTLTWHRAMFPSEHGDHSHRLSQNGYTVLESTDYSIHIDVLTSHISNPVGALFTSNSNGTFFTENVIDTNRDKAHRVDFEKLTGIQGVYLINRVENGEDVQKNSAKKRIVSEITFDDGRTFESMTVGGNKTLHLHSMTELDNVGRVFSSMAPGLVMGNGNTGKSLGKFKDSNLYVSDNAGLEWKEALKGPHKYEFGGSGSILVAIKDSTDNDIEELSYSLNHGDEWETVKLPDKLKIKPDLLTTTQDSTSLKFLLLGESGKAYHVIAIDFDGLHERTCKDNNKDMEDWHARANEDNNPTCIMGHKQTYRRRKKEADCLVKAEFKDPEPIKEENCECSDADFECDFNFRRDENDDSKCILAGAIEKPDGACKNDPDEKFMATSGWRLIPGNTCKRGKGEQKDDKKEWKCSELDSPPTIPSPGPGDKIDTHHVFKGAEYSEMEKFYLEKGELSNADDETIIARSYEQRGPDSYVAGKRLWLSNDHGKTWQRILKGEKIRSIYPHDYLKDVVFFATNSNKVIYTIDRGHSFHSFEAPTPVGDVPPLSFHPDNKDWLIWIGNSCDTVGSDSCYLKASLSTDRGDNWKTILSYAQMCHFTGNIAYKFRPFKQIVCLAAEEERAGAKQTVVTSNDFFDEHRKYFEGAVDRYAVMNEFIVLAAKDSETEELHAYAGMDGVKFEQARFPFNFQEGHDGRYTLLDASTHAINLFARTEGTADREYGSIMKSNSNGTSYVLSASHVNCNQKTYVDFERVAGIEGVILINVVTNADKKNDKTKEKQTKISHNDGAEWGYLAPPAKDVEGKPYACTSRGDKSCALHLHHYTERDEEAETFAAKTAVGVLFGTGNVGSHLKPIEDADTFMSTDGGITWKNVKKGHWTWQFGDQGSIIVLVQKATARNPVKTRTISYSLDEGETWTDHEFDESDVTVTDITTVRTGTSRRFLLWCNSGKERVFSVHLDFTGFADRPCTLTDGADSDYDLWSPKHPLQENDCLFGHVAKYLRKKPDSKCYNDEDLLRRRHNSDCECTRQDYECDYNFELDNHGQCSLVPGFEPLSGKEWCAQNPNETSWFEPTGYRKVPLSSCKGGNEMDKTSTEHPCEGYEKEFEKKHRTSGVAVFFAVVVPFGLAGAIGWYVYRNWNRNLGQIRLGDNSTATFDSDQPWVKYPVIAVSAVAAVTASLPLLLSSLWRTAKGTYERVGGVRDRSWFSRGPRRFTTRDSFARGRGDYTMVDDDEGELLGEDSDDEV